MTDRELMQQALDALEQYVGVVISVSDPNDWTPKVADAGKPARIAIEALRARLAEPEQEPVAWITGGGKGELWWHQSEKFDTEGNLIGENPDDIPLYTVPPQREWQGLTDEERYLNEPRSAEEIEYAKAIEAKLKEKNNG